MTTAIIAVLGTLLGAITSGIMSQRAARAERDAASREREREARIGAVTSLAAALSAHRATMYTRGEARLAGAPAERLQELRAEVRATRAAVSEPHVRLRLLIPGSAAHAAAERAVKATYALRDATTLEELHSKREAALSAHDAMVHEAAAAI